MSDAQFRQLLGNDAYLAQKNQSGRFTPQPMEDTTNSDLDELDRQLLEQPTEGTLQKTSNVGTLDDLDQEFAARDSQAGPLDKFIARHVPKSVSEKILHGPQAAEIGTLGPAASGLQIGSRGLVRGMGAGVVGTGALLRGGKEIVTGHPEPAFERANRWLEATGTALPPDASTGEKAAYWAGTMIPGTAIPIAMGAGVLPTIAGTLAGPLVGGATEKVAGALGLPERFGPLAGLVGGILGGGGGSAAAERTLERAVAPTRLDLKTAGAQARKDIKATGVTLEPTSVINQIIDPFTDEVGDQGKILGGKAWQLTKSLMPKDADEGVVPIGKLLGTRSALGKLTRERDPVTRELTPQAGVASNAYGKISDYINNLKDNPWYIVDAMGDKPTIAQNISSKFAESNKNYAAGIRSGNFMRNVYNKPMQKISSTYTSGNAINQVRQGAKYMLDPDHPERVTGWSDQEKAALNGILHGVNPIQNLARAVGVLGPGSQLSLWAAGLGGASALSGNPAGLVLPAMTAIGWGARKIGQAAQRRQINNLDKQIRLRSPLGEKLNSSAEGGEGAEEAEGGIAGLSAEHLAEVTHHGMQTGADISRGASTAIGIASGQSLGQTDENQKKKDSGGYSGLANRLHFATNMAMGRMKRGGYDQPTESFADPEAGRLMLARQAARPQTPMQPQAQSPYAAMLSNPQARTAIGGGQLPYPQFQVGGPTGRAGIGGYGSSPGAPMGGGGYDGVTGFLDRLAAPIVAEHQQPWTPQRAMGVLGQALGMAGPMKGLGSGAGEALAAPNLQNAIRPTQYGAGKAPQVMPMQYSTQKGDRLPTANVPWPKVGGYDGEPSIGDQAMTEVAINRAAGTTPRGILQSVLSPTAQSIGQNIGMAMSPIEAYHGSPYDFNAFDSSKIGTGEGAQAYGHGLYFAERPGVAESYKPSGIDQDWQVGDAGLKIPGWLGANIKNQGGSVDKLISYHQKMLDEALEAQKTSAYPWQEEENISTNQDRLQALKAIKGGAEIKQPGHMYQVEIGSEPEHFLDWDKPLSEQNPRVQALAKKIGFGGNPIDDNIAKGAALYRKIGDYFGPSGENENFNQAASKGMQDAGIPGIRYLDQGSRGAGEGTHNYVVFDPSIIKIMRKYGILGPVSLAGASGATQKKRDGGYNDASGGGPVQDSTTMFGGYRSTPPGVMPQPSPMAEPGQGDILKQYAQGGVPGVMQAHGYNVPNWVQSTGQFLNRPDVNQAMGLLGMIKAYHGSPYDFNAFDSSKIGTGQGAQSYGHGLYFAEHPKVAEGIKEETSSPVYEYGGMEYSANQDRGRILEEISRLGKDKAIENIQQSVEHNSRYAPDQALLQQAHANWAKGVDPNSINIKNAGHMYQVEIGSEPEHFLDWDKPLSEQPQIAQKMKPLMRSYDESLPGQVALNEVASKIALDKNRLGPGLAMRQHPELTSKALQDAGIPGIRYLDQGSRNMAALTIEPHEFNDGSPGFKVNGPRGDEYFDTKEEAQAFIKERQKDMGTHNYVVFDPSIIKIMRKYGILGPVSLAGASGATQKRQNGGYNDASGGGPVQDSTTMFGGYRSKRGWGARRGGYSVSPLAGGTSY